MSVTRKLLKGMGLTEEQQDTILEAHTETVNELKAERDSYKADAKSLPGVQKRLDDAVKELEAAKKDGWKDKHDTVKREFDEYKADQAKKETRTAKERAYRALLQAAGVSEKRLDSIVKVSDVDAIELLDDGKVKDAASLTAAIKEEWADFIVKTETTGARTAAPPANTGGPAWTKEDILKIKDTSERQRAWGQYLAAQQLTPKKGS